MVNYLAIIGAYLLGSLSFAVIVSRCMGMPDPHSYGSGNPGATNVLRTGKKSAAALTLLGDALKGWLAVWLAKHYQTIWQLDSNTIAIIAVVVLIGHMWPVFFKFKGGKGVATALGVLLALSWPTALICAAVWLIMAFGFKVSSLAALIATLISPFAAWWFMPQLSWVIAVIVIDILVLYRHKSNIKNLFSGREGKIGETK
ncbi:MULTISPECIES: glycerol-3-phosphate 1-O-acyltransferase PlsY [Snodgrassella]|uniref:glycerol-3-phosphate 1-O-acyltransferase PlsY n=1 Tax=Snodgrassella TaxID=1193515 RepID=UPI000A02CBE4|nr:MULTISPECIES: glycerol-3-phosphate 1-O-acyltransferase PlsY [Snodgrassella]MBI0180616.1 glycerol-3-phosphate 1-O-acyltransferase PlsY [Snodgrassella sp. W8158]ORF26893.1 glycerol-3-phosphate acyltransferase [Snodgrassella alvi]PIT31689.1 glycerol-3-phosphate acyltransferase [Snodgrassella alvi]PIT36719.1 glycerol-3-phosphate acyltransferase [Snodgrassella alvi]PIT64077.1 glycerol-3-phosphate acyltransferase [Snodgrassella alvi]